MKQTRNIKAGSPYNDKWNTENEYQHVLFRHGDHVSLQAGELNELQSILQSQLSYNSNHLFQNGSIIIPGSIQVLENQTSMKLELITDNTTNIKNNFKIKFANGNITQIISKEVIDTKFINTVVNDIIEEEDLGDTINDQLITILDEKNVPIASGYVVSTGLSTLCIVSDGIFYNNGYFIKLKGKDFVPSWYNLDTTTFTIGIVLSNDIVTEQDDINLYSNVQGYPDVRTAGAHRLKITANITTYTENEFKALNTKERNEFIQLIGLDSDQSTLYIKPPVEYNELEKYLSKRTYEESGHYLVTHPKYQLIEHLKTSNTNGRLPLDKGGDLTKISFGVKSFLGYIFGNRTELQSTSWIDINKPVDTFLYNNTIIPKTYNNVVTVDVKKGIPFLGEISIVDTENNILFHSTIIDSSRTNRQSIFNVSITDPISVFNMEEYNLNTPLENRIDTVGIPYVIKSKDNRFSADILSELPTIKIQDNLVKIPFDNVDNVSDVVITSFKEFNSNVDDNGILTLTTNTNNEIFDYNYQNNIVLSYEEGGRLIEIVEEIVCEYTGTPYGRTIAIQLPSKYNSKNVTGMFPIRNGIVTRKNITYSIHSETIQYDASTSKVLQLEKTFVKEIVSIVILNNTALANLEVEKYFKLKHEEKYSVNLPAKLEYIHDEMFNYEIEIIYKYKEYNNGDFVSVKSYPQSDVPVFNNSDGTEIYLSDYLDFRQIMNHNGDIISKCLFPIGGSSIQLDVQVVKDKAISICIDNNKNIFALDGTSDLNSVSFASPPSDSITLFEMVIPGKYKKLSDITVNSLKYPRYTMSDIHQLDNRIKNLEYYTSLSLLETEASTYEVLDPILGIPRFKNGFAASNFKDFALLNNNVSKFQASINMSTGGIHPMMPSYPKSFDSINLGNGLIQKDGVIMFDYEHELYLSQHLATSDISVNPYSAFTWIGEMTLFPQTDFWHDSEYAPANVVTINENRVVVTGNESRVRTTESTSTTTTDTNTTDEIIRVENSRTMRPITIRLRIDALKPNTVFDLYFDEQLVNDLTTLTGMQLGGEIRSNRSGIIEMSLDIPVSTDTRVFPTGLSVISLTNIGESPEIAVATALFESGGDITTRQLQLEVFNLNRINVNVAIPPPRVVTLWRDPIAESFPIANSPIFISQVGVFFSQKHSNISVRMEIRPLINGIIANGSIPGGVKILYPESVLTSDNASVETIFEFSRPLYLQEGTEYAIVLLSDSDEYRAYKATMGELPINSEQEALSSQPFLGVFFKSQNGSSWTLDQETDLMFNIYRAKFNTNNASCSLNFKNIIKKALEAHFVNETSTLVINNPGHFLTTNDSIIVKTDYDSLMNVECKVIDIIDGNKFTISLPKNSTDTFLHKNFMYLTSLVYDKIQSRLDMFALSKTTINSTLNTNILRTGEDRNYNTNMFETNISNKVIASDLYPNNISLGFTSETDRLSPMVNASSSGVVCFNSVVNNDIDNPIMFAETISFQFNNSFEQATLMFSAKLPASCIMKLDYKILEDIYSDSNDYEWKETSFKSITSESGAKNSLTRKSGYLEHEVVISKDGTEDINAILFRFRFSTQSEDYDIELKDFRVIAFS